MNNGMLPGNRGIGDGNLVHVPPMQNGTQEQQNATKAPSGEDLREMLKQEILNIIDTELSAEQLLKIRAAKNYDWLSSGVSIHFRRVKTSSKV